MRWSERKGRGLKCKVFFWKLNILFWKVFVQLFAVIYNIIRDKHDNINQFFYCQ